MADQNYTSIFDVEPIATGEDAKKEEKVEPTSIYDFDVAFEDTSTQTFDSGYVPYAEVQKDVEWNTLHTNDSWITGSQKFFEMTYGYVPQKGDEKLEGYSGGSYREKLADYGLKQMAGFNYNIGDMAIDSSRVFDADQETKEAFVYMLDQYDEVNTSWHTAGQAGWEMFTDITNWAGLATLGAGAVAGTAAKVAGKEAVKGLARQSIKKGVKEAAAKVGINTSAKRAGMLAGTEGALHAGVSADLNQRVRIDAGAQDEYSLAQTAAMAGIGFAAGAVIGTGLDLGISKLAGKRAEKKLMKVTKEVREQMIKKGIKAGNNLADATLSADEAIAKAVQDGLPAEDVNKLLDDQIDAGKAADELTPEQKAKIDAEKGEVDTTVLPKNLQGAKPRYNFGDRNIKLNFASDIAKALFIVGSKRKSKHYDAYYKFLQDNGIDNIEAAAKNIRDSVKAKAKSGLDAVDVIFKLRKLKRTKQKTKDGLNFKEDGSDPRPKVARKTARFFDEAAKLFDAFKADPIKALHKALQDFETERYTPKEFSDVLSVVNKMNELQRIRIDELGSLLARQDLSPAQRKLALEQLQKASDDLDAGTVLREHANAYSGRNLQDIQNYMLYRKQQGEDVTQKMIDDATEKFYKAALKQIDDEYDARINKALDEATDGDYSKVFSITRERELDADRIVALDQLEEFGVKNLRNKEPASLTDRAVELAISGVFSPSTVAYNTVFPFLKNYTYPLIDNLLTNPLDLMKWRKTIHVYAHMFGATRAAMKSAKIAAHLEQTTLTMDVNRVLEGGVKNNFFGAGMLRVFPRLLGSSDAFNQEVAAVSTLTASAFDRLLTKGMNDGLKGDALKKFIDDNIKKEIDRGYDFKLTEAKLKPIYEKGARKGLAGKALEDFVEKQIKEMGEDGLKTLNPQIRIKELRDRAKELTEQGTPESKTLAEALNKEADELADLGDEAEDSVKTLLYKKEFSKDKEGFAGVIEAGAYNYEKLAQKHPAMKLFGNLFFRTPAWLFNESLRLTPGINAMLPQFRNDLGGANGAARQARAKTEAAVGMAWMMYVTNKWAQGEIAGSPDKDYTKTAAKSKSTMRPLTIKEPFFMDNGQEVSFARWEPLRIPATIVVNVLEGYKDHLDKKNMDGYTDDGVLPDDLRAMMGIAFATAISAFKDSALTQGATDTIGTLGKMFGAFEDPDGTNKQSGADILLDFAVDKFTMVIPSTIKKGQEALGADEITQITTPLDRLISTVNPNFSELPRRYDSFGNIMKREAAYTQLTGFGYADEVGLRAGRSDDEMEALDYIATLEDMGFGNFTVQKYRDSRFPGQDLRTMDTFYDGNKMSVFDAMMREMKTEYGEVMTQQILVYARSKDLPFGSPRHRDAMGARVTKVKEILNEYRNKALDNVLSYNQKLSNEAVDTKTQNKLLGLGVSLREQNK